MNKRATLLLTSLAAFMVVLDSQVMNVALAAIRSDLHASLEALQWTVNAYTLTFAVLLLTGAALGDRFGRRRMFAGGIALFTLASFACALAPNAEALIAARTAQGAGGALVLPLSMTLLGLAYPPAERGKAIGFFTMFCGLAVIAGPLCGGALTQTFSWHAIFWLNVPVGALVLPFVLARIGESRSAETHLDGAGLALSGVAALGFVWGLLRASAAGWSDPAVVASLIAGVAFTAAFLWWEGRARAPMIPLRLFASRAFSAGNATNALFNGAMYGMLFFLPQFLQTAQHDGPFAAGLRLLPWTGALFAIAPLAGRLADRIGDRPLVAGGLFVQATGTAWLAAAAANGGGYAAMFAPLLLTGIGLAFAIPCTQRLVMNAVGRSDMGKASGTFTMLRYLGGVFGVAVLSAVFARYGAVSSARAFAAGFAPAMWADAALAFLAALTALAAPSRAAAAQAVSITVEQAA